jgi:hypothetical protein
MPGEGQVKKFTAFNKTVRHPVSIYADFEAGNVRINSNTNSAPVVGVLPKGTVSVQKAISFRIKIVSDVPLSCPLDYDHCGADVHSEFLSTLRSIEKVIRAEVFDVEREMLPLTAEQEATCEACAACPHCRRVFGTCFKQFDVAQKQTVERVVTKVRDHSHRTGQFRRVLCSDCNLVLGNRENADRFIQVHYW